MTDQEINKALALAIGWKPEQMREHLGAVYFRVGGSMFHADSPPFLPWERFDYRDWNVIGPIAERYSMFPQSISTGNFKKAKAQGYTDVESWEVFYYDYKSSGYVSGNWRNVVDKCPKRAIAMAVIGGAKK